MNDKTIELFPGYPNRYVSPHYTTDSWSRLTSFWEDLETLLSSLHTFIIRSLLFLCLLYFFLLFWISHIQHHDFTVVQHILLIQSLIWKKQDAESCKKIFPNISQFSHIKVYIFMRHEKYIPGDRVFPFKISFIYLSSNLSLILKDGGGG